MQLTPYEKERLENIQKNMNMLKDLGFGPAYNNSLNISVQAPSATSKRNNGVKRYSASKARKSDAPSVEPRLSRRQRGEQPEISEPLQENLSDMESIRKVQRELVSRDEPIQDILSKMPKNIYLPLSLASIGVTIHSIGTLVHDETRGAYWSKKGCKFRHQYPIGFKSSKIHFGKEWYSCIERGPDGPIFKVSDGQSKTYSGPTPTAPWTDVCIANSTKHGGTRISGPLFFGFSDPITIALIDRLQYFISWDEWNDQDMN